MKKRLSISKVAVFLIAAMMATGRADEYSAIEHQRQTIYHSPQTPGFTSWVGAWTMPDDSLMVSFAQATGPVEGRPRAPKEVQYKLAWPPDGHPGYDMTGLDMRNVHLRSADAGETWVQVSADSFKSCMNGVTNEAQTALADGTVLRGVFGFYLPYDPDLPQTGFLQRSSDGAKTWGKPEVPIDAAKFSTWPRRLRVLRDGRIVFLAGVTQAPAGSQTRAEFSKEVEPALLVSSDQGRTWKGPLPATLAEQRGGWTEEFDIAELANGDLLAVFRRADHTQRWQSTLRKSGDTWTAQEARPSALPHSGQPELLGTREGPILHVATNGIHWTSDAGENWHKLDLPGSAYYPRSVQTKDGRILVFGHVGGDDAYGDSDQSIVIDSFRLAGVINAAGRDEERPVLREKLPVAAIVTAYFENSHADVVVGKILSGFQQDGGPGPDLQIVSVYTDQVPGNDISRDKAREYGFRISPTIDDALTSGTNQLQVAGVLSIGEHGDYPRLAETQQKMYPRRRFFDEITATFRRCGQVVPVFNDKHLSYRRDDAQAMVDTAREMPFPFLAGSSLPVAWRMPPLELPHDCEIEEALTIGYGGLEDYGFHALEAHQCMLERRLGGETGVVAVRAVSGNQIRETETAGQWSSRLFAAARRQMPGAPEDTAQWQPGSESAVFLLEHRDGLRSSVVMANGLAGHFACAFKLKGREEPVATWFKLQEGRPYGHFAYLVRAFEEMVHTGKAPYPVERTLLTTGILDRVMHSLANNGERYETPELTITYPSTNWPFANHPKSKLLLPND